QKPALRDFGQAEENIRRPTVRAYDVTRFAVTLMQQSQGGRQHDHIADTAELDDEGTQWSGDHQAMVLKNSPGQHLLPALSHRGETKSRVGAGHRPRARAPGSDVLDVNVEKAESGRHAGGPAAPAARTAAQQ